MAGKEEGISNPLSGISQEHRRAVCLLTCINNSQGQFKTPKGKD